MKIYYLSVLQIWMIRMKAIIKIIIALLLLVCLADMPYGFYQLVRFVATAAFVYLSYEYFKSDSNVLGFVFAGLALLFQPFFKVALGRTLWNAVDVIVAIGLIVLLVASLGKNER